VGSEMCIRDRICNVCGLPTYFCCVDPATARNNLFCPICRSVSRKRHVSKVLLRELFPTTGAIARIPWRDGIRVLSASVKDPYYRLLHNHPKFVFSDLVSGIPLGSRIGEQAFCQDLQALTFDSEYFDAVITEDVLEHVRDANRALREIHRVLKFGGLHVFTVPFNFDQQTIVRVDTSGPEDELLMPPEYHGDPLRGNILAYRTFGLDMFDLLTETGFETKVERSNYADYPHGIVDSYVFVSRKKQVSPYQHMS